MSNRMIGQAVPRVEATRFVAGRGRYVDDVQRPGQVYARVVRSAVAHGVIRGIDCEAARGLPGVLDVITGVELAPLLKPIPQRTVPLPGMEHFAQLPMAVDTVRYVGEPVALVIADDPYLAEDAAELVQARIDPLDVVVDAHEAMKDEILLHPAQGTNKAAAYQVGFGDAEHAFERAHLVVQERFYVHRHSAVPLECRGLVAEWDAGRQHMSVWGAAKVPYANRGILAGMLGLEPGQVDMIECDVGGSFGVRGDFYPEDFLVPYAARKLARPVKWVEDRRENLMALNHSRETHCELAIAFDAEGRILGMRGTMLVDHGAYVRTNTGVMAGKGTQFLPGPYRVPATRFDVFSVCTNKTPAGTYRGPGRYESTFARERLLDIAAQKLGVDPVVLRQRNLIRPEELPYDAGALVPNMGPAVYDSGNYPEVLTRALQAFRWQERIKDNGKLRDGRYIGFGLACFVESTGGGPGEYARLTLRHDGCLDLAVGASTAGQGHETSMAQVLAEELDVPMAAIRVWHGSTTLLDKGFGAYHSRSAVMSGSAVHRAALAMRERLLERAAQQLGRPAASLAWRDGCVVDGETGEASLTLSQLAQGIAPHDHPTDRGEVEVVGEYFSDQLTYTFGVHLAEVAVDPQTASVDVLDYYCVEDLGRVINPEIVHGQAIGAAMQGLGGTFLDEFVYDESGQLLTGTFADYLLPTSTEFPVIRGDTLELSPSPGNPLGVKGAGEGGIVPTGAVIGNAVSHALAGMGISITTLPISMNNLAALLRDARSRQAGEPMKIEGDYLLEAEKGRVWDALLDPDVLKACLPGCERITATGPNEYELEVKAAVGPVGVRMRSRMRLLDMVERESYRMVVEGNAGPAGFAKGEVRVKLDEPGAGKTRLRYEANGEIGGKLAQVGARLVEGVVAKMTAQFFDRFQAHLGRPQHAAAPPAAVAPAPAMQAGAASIWPPASSIPWLIAAASLGALAATVAMCAFGG
ncbi:MAG: molybdopterin-dependent oxidoreductase [Pigmentiphaga sp.]|uniref:molybdopterin cofactor-binding domain-containing protein n=1 Tax=Pigmentiphaga sp. TaxID=1977564 RepID=UPI0029B8BB8D|nr:molybdopterin cofactor-binding domain-containing protein [Pigmentiphaga sp.]MDX3905146.1 molybdopterin-dependent oxidoreductase [Pigmentiphaga sp.]